MLKRLLQKGLAGIVGAVLAAGVTAFLLNPGYEIGRGLILASYDLSVLPLGYNLDDPALDEVVLVYLDDESADKLDQPYTGIWDRASTHGQLLERLKADGAKAAVFDIVFTGSTIDAQDQGFARAMAEFGPVVLAADTVGVAEERPGASGKQLVLPSETLMEQAAGLGTAEIIADEDLVVRRITPYTEDELIPPLAWAAADAIGAAPAPDPLGEPQDRWINYYVPARTMPSVSYYEALSPDSRLSAGFFRDKVVFIGSGFRTKTAGERKDEYRSPFSLWTVQQNVVRSMDEVTRQASEQHQFMPGVEVQATMFLNLTRQEWLLRLPFWRELTLCLLIALVFGFGLPQLRPLFASVIAGLAIVGTAAAGFHWVEANRVWFAWLVPVFVIGFTLFWSVVYNSINLYVQKRLMQQSLAMYVSPSQVKKIIKKPDILKPGAEKTEISILFSDIANFTTMSEGMDSDELATLMNSYFEGAVSNCIHRTDGTVVKFIGDAIFAIWNAPEQQNDHSRRACHGALLLRDQVTTFKGSKSGLDVRTRIGLHCGVANVGNFGSATRVDYTAFGENINLASRMEGLNKHLGTTLLITGDMERAVRDQFVTRPLGSFQLKGFEKAIEVFELVSLPNLAEASRPYRKAFAEGLKQFRQREFAAAEEAFRNVLEIRPADGPAKFYLKQIEELRLEPPPDDWSGQIELKEK